MNELDTAIKLAVDAHAGQTDKGGQPYILHVLRVMLAQTDNTARIVGVLHDVVEDSDIGHADILTLFGDVVHDAVFAITRQDGEDYFDFVRRAIANPIARRVKVADLHDNLDDSRAVADADKAKRLREKYLKALQIVEDTE